MLDVIHTIYERDVVPTWEQEPELKSKVRAQLYEMIYKKSYKYALSEGHRNYAFDEENPKGFPITEPNMSTKPYIPPTNPNDLMRILDGPMGG